MEMWCECEKITCMELSVREQVVAALSPARMGPYLERCSGNVKQGLELYRWHSDLTAAVQSVLGVTEVIVRNAMDQRLQEWNNSQLGYSTSWLLETPATPLRSLSADKRKDALRRARSQAQARPASHWRYGQPVSHDDVLAQIMFGMWKDLLPNHDPHANPNKITNLNRRRMWNETLREAFPHVDDPDGHLTYWRVAHLHRLRNRVSHMEPLFDVNIKHSIREAFDLIASINPNVAQWVSGISRVSAVAANAPHQN